jgi:hypothetical protein
VLLRQKGTVVRADRSIMSLDCVDWWSVIG